MNIKTILAAACGIGIAASALAYTGPTKAPPGTDNIAFGYGAGYMSSGDNLNVVVIGTDAGMGSVSNTNCVFIGRGAGSSYYGQDGAVVISGSENNVEDAVAFEVSRDANGVKKVIVGGDVFVHEGGVTTIKGVDFGNKLVTNAVNHVGESFALGEPDSSYNFLEKLGSGWHLWGSCETASSATTAEKSRKLCLYGSDDYVVFRFESGSLCVYTNGVKAGTLSFTPVQ